MSGERRDGATDGDEDEERSAPRPYESRRWRRVAFLLGVTLVIGAGAYGFVTYARPYLRGSNCEAKTADGRFPLDLEQAANAATIAAVAFGRRLPERAAVIAYATSIQESHIRNLRDGHLDSVGMFQQRPSQGWGTAAELRDPVTASERFYGGLVKVRDYLDREVHDAAQKVQRSADGEAYARHEGDAEILAEGYTGRRAAAVRCWYTPGKERDPRRAEAIKEMRRAFGGKLPAPENGAIKVGGARTGWAAASWAVSHAQPYGLREVRFAGRRWQAEKGHDGWTKAPKAPRDRVLIR